MDNGSLETLKKITDIFCETETCSNKACWIFGDRKICDECKEIITDRIAKDCLYLEPHKAMHKIVSIADAFKKIN